MNESQGKKHLRCAAAQRKRGKHKERTIRSALKPKHIVVRSLQVLSPPCGLAYTLLLLFSCFVLFFPCLPLLSLRCLLRKLTAAEHRVEKNSRGAQRHPSTHIYAATFAPYQLRRRAEADAFKFKSHHPQRRRLNIFYVVYKPSTLSHPGARFFSFQLFPNAVSLPPALWLFSSSFFFFFCVEFHWDTLPLLPVC